MVREGKGGEGGKDRGGEEKGREWGGLRVYCIFKFSSK